MKADLQPDRDGTGPDPGAAALCVLLVGQNAAALQALAVLVHANVPKAYIQTLASTTELVFRLAADDVAIVLIDRACIRELPPSLLGLSRRVSGRPRLALVDESGADAPAIGLQDLPAWLRRAAAQPQPRPHQRTPPEPGACTGMPKVPSP